MMNRLLAAALLLLSGAAPAGFLYYEQPDPSPYLADIGTPPACDFVISDVAGWAQINNTSYRVFCVAPGDYSAAGKITITADGTAVAPRWIRYYDATGVVGDAVHPYHMALAQRARVDKLYFSAANYWVVDRLYIDSTGTEAAFLLTGSDNNVLNRLYLYDFWQGLIFNDGSDYNVIQNSVAQKMTHGSDGVAFQMLGRNYDGLHPLVQPKFNRVVSNECFDVNDCVHLSGNDVTWSWYSVSGEEDYEGSVIYNNDLYLTTASYTNCNGTYTTSGACACKENAFDFKSGTENASNPVIFAHNRMWGWRPTDQVNCNGPSAPGTSVASAVGHFKVKNFRLEGNIYWDGGGLSFSGEKENITISGNLHHEMPSLAITNYIGYGLNLTGTQPTTNVEIAANVFSEIDLHTALRVLIFSGTVETSATAEYSTNVSINSNQSTTTAFAGTISGNKYYNTTEPVWDTSPAADEASVTGSGWDNQFCTTIKRITAPETKCFANALYLSGAPIPITPPSNFLPVD